MYVFLLLSTLQHAGSVQVGIVVIVSPLGLDANTKTYNLGLYMTSLHRRRLELASKTDSDAIRTMSRYVWYMKQRRPGAVRHRTETDGFVELIVKSLST